MGVLNIDDLKDGMVLADNLLNKHGNMLIKKGTTLSEHNIIPLKAWGVTEINVVGVDQKQVDQEETQTLPAEVIDSIEKELKMFFPYIGGDLVMEEIYRVVKKFRLKQAIIKERTE